MTGRSGILLSAMFLFLWSQAQDFTVRNRATEAMVEIVATESLHEVLFLDSGSGSGAMIGAGGLPKSSTSL